MYEVPPLIVSTFDWIASRPSTTHARLGEGDREGQADVAEADDADLWGASELRWRRARTPCGEGAGSSTAI